ncbi:MAG: type I restriction enzyme HsdR N-terminal domain-containing protein [Bacteroidota bacterium]
METSNAIINIVCKLLDFKSFLKFKTEKGKRFIYDPIRKKWLVNQPEELVRQLLIQFLIQEQKYNPNFLKVEKGIEVNGMRRRCDIIIYNKDYNPILLIECKAPEIKLDQKVIDQIAQYNIHFKVPYLYISNGQFTYGLELDFEEKNYSFLSHFPDIHKLNDIKP